MKVPKVIGSNPWNLTWPTGFLASVVSVKIQRGRDFCVLPRGILRSEPEMGGWLR